MYFDGCYFDGTYFDASECVTPPPSSGSHLPVKPRRRIRFAATPEQPDPFLDDEEALLVLEGL